MPYTAPLKTSPSTQHIEHSDPSTPPSPSSPIVADPHADNVNLPQSYSSTSYVRRHRRSPSNSKSFVFPAPENGWESNRTTDIYASIRQSPPPVSEGPIPPGALLSPPESGQNSSDEESANRSRDVLQLEELEAAVRSIEQRRTASPERQQSKEMHSTNGGAGSPGAAKQLRPLLTKDNRMISRSRSFVENSINREQEEALTSSPEESDRDDEPRAKYPMVRKKSGELVRPALRPPSARRRPSSMPGTPTYSKAVHFDAKLEHIRHFLQLDKPQAVSAGSSPVEELDADGEYPFGAESSGPSFEWGLRLSNFPHKPPSQPHQRVRLEHLFLSSDKSSLVGIVVVANLAYNKHVAARFTFDSWRTTSEVIAEYSHDVRRKQLQDGYDRFMFNIKLDEQTNLDKKTMFVCIRYNVNGQEFWDNNDTRDYQVNFTKIPKPKPRNQDLPRPRPRANLPRSRSFTGSGSRPHSMPSSLKEFSDMHRYISFGPPLGDRKGKAEMEDDIPHDSESPVPIRRDKQSHQVFGNRYDFELSLSAAMRSTSDHDRTVVTTRAKSETPMPRYDLQSAPPVSQPAQASPEKPSSLASSKPHRESSVYRELVDRYCFYGSPNSSPNLNRPLKAIDSGSSPATSPSSPSSPSGRYSPKESVTDASRSLPASPPTFRYKYFEPMQERLFKETQTPAMISG
ncbi:putative phosphatase regulatory subunit-domain-containing protein [Aspergillus cavernicola]|uniref:Phosphatase regulatory subunit-domain-containing protein n=1 Tax=Aspergillus cavernicola TaxID=176166 RepID=A0ABR4IS31_9EURO